MSVKRPGSALSSGAESLEPLDPKQLQKTVKSGELAAQIDELGSAVGAGETTGVQSATLQGLKEIASNTDFSVEEKSEAVIRESANFIIKSRIHEKFREQEKITEMIEELSDFVVKDPFIKKKLKDVLQRLQEK